MTATPAITDDAVGISQTGKSKTSGVVDLLTSPTVAAGDHTIVDIPVKYVVPHPRNRKILDGDVDDLVAEFKAGIPILNPLGVTAAADWNANRPADLKDISPLEFIITAGGHRRLRAAELAGLKTVPCIVRATFAGVEGRRAALLENLHRQDLDPFEEAAAFEELTGEPYKLSQRDLAGIVGCRQPHISKRLKLLKLPSTIRESVRVGKLHIGDALELARVADEPQLLKTATEKVKQWGWDAKHAVDEVLAEKDRDEKRQVEVDRLTAAGIKVLDRAPGYQATTSTRDPVRLDALGIKTVSHKKEPCHAAYVRTASWMSKPEVTYCCSDPKRHIGKKAESKVQAKVTATSAGRAMSDAEREAKKRRQEIKKNVNPARRAVVKQLVQAGGFDAETRRGLVTQCAISLLVDSGYGACDDDVAVDLLGIRPPNSNFYLGAVIRDHAKTAKPENLALVGAIAYFERRLNDPTQYSPWGEIDRWYLDTLARNGYVITDAEHEQLRDTRNEDGTWTPRKADDDEDLDGDIEVRTCVKCGCTDMEACDGGCTWVAENLCSSCSDAVDAGWVESDHPSPVEVPQPGDPANVDEPAAVAG